MITGKAGFQVNLTTNTLAGLFPVVQISGQQTISFLPEANPLTTLGSLVVQGQTQSLSTREFMFSAGMLNNKGKGLTAGNNDKVTGYFGHTMVAGCGDGWSINSVITIAATADATANAQGFELDHNNLKQHYGEAAWGPGLIAPIATGLSITGASTFRSTAALLIAGPGTEIWNRGVVFASTSIKQAAIQDLTNSAVSIEILGNHTTGIDLSNASCTNSIKSYNFTLSGIGAVSAYSYQIGSGPTWTSGTGVPGSTQPKGSMFSRTDGAAGSTLYVSQGAGVWNPVTGV